jgi:hypothetical protein
LAREEAAGNREVLAAISAYGGLPVADVTARFREAVAGDDSAIASPDDVRQMLDRVATRVRLAPIAYDVKTTVLSLLAQLNEDPPKVTETEIAVWDTLHRSVRPTIVVVDREPVILPDMPAGQQAAWNAVLDLEENLTAHWCLIGGQMIALISAEHGFLKSRPTTDADIVVGVWIEREALKQASRVLDERGFAEDQTYDGYGYRYQRGDASVDLLMPEGISDQNTIPRTTTGRRGLEVDGGNQALMRAEKIPVQLGQRTGYVRRPNLLGALVAKAAAAVADTRAPDRHREDIAVLAQLALESNQYRQLRRMARPHDRQRLRKGGDVPQRQAVVRCDRRRHSVRSGYRAGASVHGPGLEPMPSGTAPPAAAPRESHCPVAQPPSGSPAHTSCKAKGRMDNVYSYVWSGWTWLRSRTGFGVSPTPVTAWLACNVNQPLLRCNWNG